MGEICYVCGKGNADLEVSVFDTCQSCQGCGHGVIPDDRCYECKGSGESRQMVPIHESCLLGEVLKLN
jgi:DnaJ-class molecular chaperone